MTKIYCAKPKMLFPVISWLIRLVEWKPYSHMAIQYLDSEIMDSTGKGVRAHTVDEFFSEYSAVKTYETQDCSEISASNYEDFKAKFIGDSYGYWENFGFLLMRMGLIKKNPFAKDSTEH